MLKDMLEDLFAQQDLLNARFGRSQATVLTLSDEERLQIVRNFAEAQLIESGEVLKAAQGRWWKKEKDWLGWDHLKEEIIDEVHFLVSKFMAAGGTPREFYDIYTKKNQFNHKRPDWKINENKDSSHHPSGSEVEKGDGRSLS